MVEIRFHGRGGQGAVTAAQLLVAAAFKAGKKGVQAFPFFGAERRGAPVMAFARVADEEVVIHSQIYNPDVVVVLDSGVMEYVDVAKGVKEGGLVIINTTKKPSEYNFGKVRVATVDATGIAMKNKISISGIPIVNTAILGSIAKCVNWVGIEHLEKAITEKMGEKAPQNIEAIREAYNSTVVA
ncbi:MAG: 2-oxoacid:acceptor oxidoreductase family protein [Candidatus Thermoplasmatota archaeon]|nr:2-oxoacid:acceptor oxidoreductase family protein [Candidatus Thermoplasmatota archaeon]